MDELLKGNFTVKQPVLPEGTPAPQESSNQALAEKLRKAALASIGGSMVYMERTELIWLGDDK